jgi:hypothetical protein
MVFAVQHLTPKTTYILFDDFIGSGSTLYRQANAFVQRLRTENVPDVNVKLMALAGMSLARPNLDQLGLEYYCPVWLERGISDAYAGPDLQHKTLMMEALEEALALKCGKLKLEKYRFGYKRSESLYCVLGYNVPNNVFPVFWWPQSRSGAVRRPIFNRVQ